MSIDHNLTDLYGNTGPIGSQQSSAQGELAGISTSSDGVKASDNAVVQNSGNTTTTATFIDPGAIAAAEQIALSALNSNQEITDRTLSSETQLATIPVQGPVTTFFSKFFWIPLVAFVAWLLYLFLDGRKRET